MLLTLLPKETRVPLPALGAGVVAVVRPMDTEDKAGWYTECLEGKLDVGSPSAAVVAVRRQLVGLEGVTVVPDVPADAAPDAAPPAGVPFDPADPEHMRAVPMALVTLVFDVLMSRAGLTEPQRGN